MLLSNAKGWSHLGPESPRCFQGALCRIWCDQILLGATWSITSTNPQSRKKTEEVYTLKQHHSVHNLANKGVLWRHATVKRFRFSAILKTASKCSRFPRKSVSWRLQSFKKWTTMPRPGPGWGAPGTGQDLGPLVPCAKLPPPPPKNLFWG